MPTLRVSESRVIAEMVGADASSRKALCGRLGVSKASVGRVVSRLVETGWVIEGDRFNDSPRGRKTTALAVRPELAFVVGADLEGMAVRACVMDCARNVLAAAKRPLGARSSMSRIVSDWMALIASVIRDAGVPRSRIAGIGVGIPAKLTREDFRSIAYLPPGRRIDFDFREALSRFDLPVVAADNIVCVSEYERRMGDARNADSFISVLVRYGVGAAIYSGGSFIVGERMLPAQLGHMRLDPNGPACICGRRGCLDAFISGRTWPGPRRRTGAAWEKDIVRRSRYLAIGIANVLKLIHAPMIILNGIYNPYESTVSDILNAVIAEELSPLGLATPRIVFGKPVEHKTDRGAAMKAVDAFLESHLSKRLHASSARAKRNV